MIGKEDIVLLISNSGETDEVLKIIPFLKEQGNVTIAMSGNPLSTLAKNSTYHLNIHVEKEACPLQLAPTSSTTATLVMGDALAITLMKLRDFKESDFAQFHPGGSLGRRLLTRVEDVMKKENLPIVNKKSSIKEIINTISKARLGLAIVQAQGQTVGIITDGDIRRAMEEFEDSFFTLKAEELMSQSPKTIEKEAKLIDAQNLMNESKVNSLLVTNKRQLLGVVQIYDLAL